LRNPESVEAHANLGAIQLKQGRLDKAEPLILKALELTPDYTPALENLGFLRELRQRK
jgi:Flp pilus assembly protein TadD